jgi:hypothetical protein
MALPATEAFAGAAGALGASWTQQSQFANVNVNGSGLGTPSAMANGVDTLAFWNADAFGADQYAQIAVKGFNAGSSYVGVGVRQKDVTDTAMDGYTFSTDGTTGAGHTEIAKYVNGTRTALKAVATTFAVNDVIRVEVSGTTITAKKGTTTLDSTIDASLATGSAGIDLYWDFSTAPTADDWEGGNLGSVAVTMVPRQSRGPWRRRRSKAAALGGHGPQVRGGLRRAFVVSTGSVITVAGASEGDSADALILNAVRQLAGATSGTSASALTLNAVRKLSGLATGTSASSLLEITVRLIAGASSGSSASATALKALRLLAGATSGTSADAATLEAVRLIIAASSGQGISALALNAVRLIAGATSGTSVSNAALVSDTAPLGGVTTGQSASALVLIAVRQIIGASSGSSNNAGAVGGVSRIVAGSTSGVSFSDATIAAAGTAPEPPIPSGGGGFSFRPARKAAEREDEQEPIVRLIEGHTSGTSRSECRLIVVSPPLPPAQLTHDAHPVLVGAGAGEWTADDDFAALFALMES